MDPSLKESSQPPCRKNSHFALDLRAASAKNVECLAQSLTGQPGFVLESRENKRQTVADVTSG
jgi:hypothetical protein